MKRNNFIEGIKFSLGILFVFAILGTIYAVGFHTANEVLSGTFLGNYVFNGTTTFNKTVDINSNLIRKIIYNTSNGPVDNTNVGKIVSRVLYFNKIKTNTKIRFLYTDNFRNYNVINGACRWELKVDSTSCPQPLVYDVYTANGNSLHRFSSVLGYCTGLLTGSHKVEIFVGPVPGGDPQGDCYTGYNSETWVIEAQEIN